MNARASTIALAAAFVLLWSSGWIAARVGLQDVGLFTLLGARYVVVTLVLGALVVAMRRWRPMSRRSLAIHALVGLLSHALYLGAGVGAFSLGVGAGTVAFVTALQPMVSAGLSVPVTRERLSPGQWTGLALGLAAVLLVITARMRIGFSATALVMPVISVLALSVGCLLQRRAHLEAVAARREPPCLPQLLLVQVGAACLVLVPLAAITDEPPVSMSPANVGVVLWLALGVSLGAYGVMASLLTRLSAFQVSSLTYLTPPTTMLMAWLTFGEGVRSIDLVGLLIAALGVWFTLRPWRRQALDPRFRHLPTGVPRRSQLDIEL